MRQRPDLSGEVVVVASLSDRARMGGSAGTDAGQIPGQLEMMEFARPVADPDELTPAILMVYQAMLTLGGPAHSHEIGERIRRPANSTAARCGELVRLGLARQLPDKVPGPYGVSVVQWELIR